MQFQSMNISLLHMYRVYLPLYQNCIDSVVLISLNVTWNIRNEVHLFLYKQSIFDPQPKSYLKLVSAIFYQFFIYHQIIALQKIWKIFFISSKKLFSFSRYSSFCIFVFPIFFSLSAIALAVDPRKILKFMTSSTV